MSDQGDRDRRRITRLATPLIGRSSWRRNRLGSIPCRILLMWSGAQFFFRHVRYAVLGIGRRVGCTPPGRSTCGPMRGRQHRE